MGSAITKRVRSLSETSQKEKLEEDNSEEENLEVDLDEKLGQRRDTLASIDSGIGEELRAAPETGLRLISLNEVRDHFTMEDGWMVLYDRVYQGVGHSKAASRMLQPNLIGILPHEERLN